MEMLMKNYQSIKIALVRKTRFVIFLHFFFFSRMSIKLFHILVAYVCMFGINKTKWGYFIYIIHYFLIALEASNVSFWAFWPMSPLCYTKKCLWNYSVLYVKKVSVQPVLIYRYRFYKGVLCSLYNINIRIA